MLWPAVRWPVLLDIRCQSGTHYEFVAVSLGFIDVGLPLGGENMSIIVAGPHHHSRCWARAPQISWPYFTASNLRFPHPGGPGPRTYVPQ
jgi:hypothetical protein